MTGMLIVGLQEAIALLLETDGRGGEGASSHCSLSLQQYPIRASSNERQYSVSCSFELSLQPSVARFLTLVALLGPGWLDY